MEIDQNKDPHVKGGGISSIVIFTVILVGVLIGLKYILG
jgi:hypothetical protein